MPHEDSPAVTGLSILGSAAKQPSCAASMPEPESAVTPLGHQLAAEQAERTSRPDSSAWAFSSWLDLRGAPEEVLRRTYMGEAATRRRR